MRMTAFEAIELNRLSEGRCPIHVRHNAACSICVRIQQRENPMAQLDAVELESDLQEQIEAECLRRGWPFVRSRMDKKTSFTFPGVPDFVIAADNSRTIWMEAKARKSKQTPEQIGFQMMLNRCGHPYHLVRSMSEVIAVFNAPKSTLNETD